MPPPEIPPTVSVIGWKNSGKTTLVVALAAELKRRGLRVASLKHGHHDFEIDHPGRDSWRHYHEGEVEAVLLASAGKLALVTRDAGETDPERLVERFFAGRGYDVVIAEGYKQGPFPKIEVFRRGTHPAPIYPGAAGGAGAEHLALVTDDPDLRTHCPVVPLDPSGSHVAAVADLIFSYLSERGEHGA